MMVMIDQRGARFGYLCALHPGRLGNLISPPRWSEPLEFAPYAIDNGAFTGFNELDLLAMIQKARRAPIPPIWIVVPDAVGDAIETIRLWREWEPRLRPLGWPLAMAMQDGMTPDDCRGDIAFIGGTTEWKWRNLSMWAGMRFHVGRVNTERHLWQCHDAGAESCDGTGWFRGNKAQFDGLLRYIERTDTGKPQHDTLPLFDQPR